MAELNEDRIKHLELIQDVIARMAGESARMKQFALAAVGVLASTSAATHAVPLAYVAGALSVIFWLLDARYVRLERGYRALYDQVRSEGGPADFRLTLDGAIQKRQGLVPALFGWSVAPLYGALVVIAVLLARSVTLTVAAP